MAENEQADADEIRAASDAELMLRANETKGEIAALGAQIAALQERETAAHVRLAALGLEIHCRHEGA